MDIALMIMAAGAGSRMEGIKQLLPWRNSNFLLESIKTAKECKVNRIQIVLGANAEIIKTGCSLDKLEQIKVIVNPEWSQGLGNSIAYGIGSLIQEHKLPDAVLVCLADQPLITSNYLNKLIDIFLNSPKKIVATKYRNKAGVPAIFDKSIYHTLVTLNGDEGAKHVLHTMKDDMATINGEELIKDIDTQKEYEELQKQYGRDNI